MELRQRILSRYTGGDISNAVQASVAPAIISNLEIAAAVSKRFKGRTPASWGVTFYDLVIWCLCTKNHVVSGQCMSGVFDEDVEAAWGFLDTIKVSSSMDCSNLVREAMGKRSGDSFRRATNKQRPRPTADKGQRKVFEGTPALIPDTTWSCATVEEAMVEDAVLLGTLSGDPLGVAVSMYESTRTENKKEQRQERSSVARIFADMNDE